MVFHRSGKSSSYLSSHEDISYSVLFEIFVDGNEIQTDIFFDNVHLRATRQGGIHIHHACVKSIAGIGGNTTFACQFIEFLIPSAKVHYVVMLNHTTFWYTCGT